MKKIYLTLNCIFLVVSLSLSQTPGSGVVDIDGNQYSTVIIGSQEWMAENLRTSSYNNGEPIPNVIVSSQWWNLNTGAWTYYYDLGQAVPYYGKLYNWYAVNDSRNLCPTGWHVPTDTDWNTLITYLDPSSVPQASTNPPGYKMKSIGTQDWQSPNTGATNQSGFSGLPRGARNPNFSDLGRVGCWWSSTESVNKAWFIALHYNYDLVFRAEGIKYDGYSVRCLKGGGPLELIELHPANKELVKIVDLLGRETEYKSNTVLIYVYSDGTTERVFKVE